MRNIVEASVCNCSGKIGKVQRCCTKLALSNCKGYYRIRVPTPLAIEPVIPCGRGQASAKFRGKITAKLLSKAKTSKILQPFFKCLLYGRISLVLKQIYKDIAEIGIAGGHYGVRKIQWRGVRVASQFSVAVRESHTARISCLCGNHPLLKAYEAIYKLKDRARRVCRHNRPVKHGFIGVVKNLIVVVAYICQLLYLYSWTGDKCENLSC